MTLPAEFDEVPPRKVDGRHQRRIDNRILILAHARLKMITGTFRPSAQAIATAANCSLRSVFQHFGSIEKLWLEAIDHEETRYSILAHILGTAMNGLYPEILDRILFAAVLGRVKP